MLRTLMHRLRKSWFVLLTIPPVVFGQDPAEVAKISWEHGPTLSKLGTQAQVNVPKGFLFTDSEGSRKFAELNQNVPSGREVGVLAPDDLKWFVVFEFDESGYIKDDEKSSLDADAMLKSIQSANERGNEERKRRGWGTVTVLGWVHAPHYDESTSNLEWSTKAKDEQGNLVSNHNTRYLGRRGVMRVTLVTDPDALASTLLQYRKVMSGFSYTPDNSYRAFVKGDKVAEYGLTALVVGGAAAAAAKTGFLKSFWKLIVAALVGLGSLLKRLFSSKAPQSETEGS